MPDLVGGRELAKAAVRWHRAQFDDETFIMKEHDFFDCLESCADFSFLPEQRSPVAIQTSQLPGLVWIRLGVAPRVQQQPPAFRRHRPSNLTAVLPNLTAPESIDHKDRDRRHVTSDARCYGPRSPLHDVTCIIGFTL